MPCTSTRVSRSTRMLTERTPSHWSCARAGRTASASASADSCGVRRTNRLCGRLIHAVAGGQPCLGEESPSFLRVGPGETDDDWHRDIDSSQGFRYSLRHDVAPGDATENVNENRTHACVGGDEAKCLGDLIGAGTAADVEEVRRLPPVEHHGVHGGHCQTGAVDDAPDVAAELDE